jgi:hypothetical protein
MTELHRRIPWYASTENLPGGGPLGRHVRHDERSRAFAYPTRGLSLVSTVHVRRIPVLDQGDVGSCTGNAALGVLGTDPHYPLTQPRIKDFSEDFAVGLYSSFTAEDGYEGTYPPDDTGSDGLTSGKVLKEMGFISGYQHTFSFNDALLALTQTPFVTGVNWYSSMDVPDENGHVTISRDAYIRGGHEFEAFAVDVENRLVWFWNSWGMGWGLDGKFSLSFDDYARLLGEDGDVTVYAPLTAPVPTPAPVADPDAELAAASRTWAWVTRQSKAGKAVAKWRTERGL